MHLLTFYLALLLSTTILASETTVQKLATLECQDEETQWYNGERPGAERPLRTKKVCCKPVAAAKLQQMREAGIPDVDIKYSCVEFNPINQLCRIHAAYVFCCEGIKFYDAHKERQIGDLGMAENCYAAKEERGLKQSVTRGKMRDASRRKGRGPQRVRKSGQTETPVRVPVVAPGPGDFPAGGAPAGEGGLAPLKRPGSSLY